MTNKTLAPLSPEAQTITIGALYQHYKGNHYKILAIARHSETLEELVVYQALYEDHGIWVRPIQMFCESVVFEKKEQKRFQKI